jgi:ATP-dependent DNA helicase RecG
MYVKEKGQVTNTEYQEICNTSARTSSRDLTDLVSRGLFKQKGTIGKGIEYTLIRQKNPKHIAVALQRCQTRHNG